jgi:DNA ligase D-like protein (predicted ligase)/DNA ligase D-like protein (predicted polymerase)
MAAAKPSSTNSLQPRFTRANIMRALPDAVAPSPDELRAYWTKVGKQALPYLARRPLTLVRHANGLTFFHKGPLPPVPKAVHQLPITKATGEAGVRVWVDDIAGLLGLVEMDAVELHPWGATVDDIEHPDFLVFDLDPGEGIAWEFVLETAMALRAFLQDEGFDPWLKTSGGKGLHIMVPVDRRMDWPKARAWSKEAAARFARRDRRYTISSTTSRAGKIFIDYLRNGRGNTAVGAFSPRARPGFPVSYPIGWEELANGIRADSFTMDDLMTAAGPRRTPRAAAKRAAKIMAKPARVAKEASAPAFIEPELATLVAAPPDGDEWLHEMKFDGYRGEIAVAGGNAHFYTRRGNDWTADYPALMAAAGRLKCRSALIDGEAVVLDENGVPDFNLMQRSAGDTVTYFAFDLLHLDGRDLRRLPLVERKQRLKELLERSGVTPTIRYSDHVVGKGGSFLEAACGHRLEGIVSKRADAPYRSGRYEDWLKSKCTKRQEFVVGGWLMRREDPKDLGALLVGYFESDLLLYAGKVGTGKGFGRAKRKEILAQLARLEADHQTFVEVPKYDQKFVHWTHPKMVVEVEFTDFTGDGLIRHPSLVGVRRDKAARDVVLEVPRNVPAPGIIERSKPRWRRRNGV